MLKKGLVQIYTGDGKGKTTAAFGLALRALGQGNKVLIYQFLKPGSLDIGERFALKISGLRLRVEPFDIEWDIATSLQDEKKMAEAKASIKNVLGRIAETARKRFYDVLILDEIVYCLARGLADIEDIRRIIELRDPGVEIVLTGREATKELMDMADLVTDMRNIRHPFEKGIVSRRGIDF